MSSSAEDGPGSLYGGVSLAFGLIGLLCLAGYAWGTAPLALVPGPLAVTFGMLGLVSRAGRVHRSNRVTSALGLLTGLVPVVLLLLMLFSVASV